MQLAWMNCQGNLPCGLFSLNLDSITASQGVYVIWCNRSHASAAIHVGQVRAPSRKFKDRFLEHRSDPTISKHCAHGLLYVSWATVLDFNALDGIELYLFNVLQPMEGIRAPAVTPIQVNLPYPFVHLV